MKDINVGVIGVGAMGYNHARVYYKLENANLIAVSDVSEMTLDKVSKNMMLRLILIIMIY